MFPFHHSGDFRRFSFTRSVLRAVAVAAGTVAVTGSPTGQPSTARAGQSPLTTTSMTATATATVERGRALFAKHCASCHGPDGRGDGSAGRDLDPLPTNLHDPEISRRPDAQLFRQITRGRRPMPSFGRLLSENDRWTLVAFVKSVAASDGERPAR